LNIPEPSGTFEIVRSSLLYHDIGSV
jgi:hypothetical protein